MSDKKVFAGNVTIQQSCTINTTVTVSILQVILPSNRTTVYDTLLVPVNQVFVFSDRISDLETKELEEMVMDFQGSVVVILVEL